MVNIDNDTKNALWKLQAIHRDMERRVLGQRNAITVLLAAVVAGEHVCLVGPPGEAKSLLASVLASYFEGNFFSWLMTAFTTPNEVLGGPSIKALQEDRQERVTTRKLPEANMALLDEIWKCNSPMLNALLSAMNERVVDGNPIPLRTVVGLSNEWPAGLYNPLQDNGGDETSLSALWDRFLWRLEIKAVDDDDALWAIMTGQVPEAPTAKAVNDHELSLISTLHDKVIQSLAGSDRIRDAILELNADLKLQGVSISTRRWRKAMSGLAAHAVLRAAMTKADEVKVTRKDLTNLNNLLWELPQQREAVREAVAGVGASWDVIALETERVVISLRAKVRRIDPRSSEGLSELQEIHKALERAEQDVRAAKMDADDENEDDFEPMRVLSVVDATMDEVLRAIASSMTRRTTT